MGNSVKIVTNSEMNSKMNIEMNNEMNSDMQSASSFEHLDESELNNGDSESADPEKIEASENTEDVVHIEEDKKNTTNDSHKTQTTSDESDEIPIQKTKQDLFHRRKGKNGEIPPKFVLPQGESTLQLRARRLRHHYNELESCDKIMAYGFILIMFICVGFYWFTYLFSKQIRMYFSDYHVIAPAFLYGTLLLGAINLLLR